MDYFKKTKRQYTLNLLAALVVSNALVLSVWIVLSNWHVNLYITILATAAVFVLFSLLFALSLSNYLIEPVKAIWQLILSIGPHGETVEAPKIEAMKVGREMTLSLSRQIYQMTSSAAPTKTAAVDRSSVHQLLNDDFVASKLPLPLFVLDQEENIVFANATAGDYLGISAKEMTGKNFYMIMDMSFPSENTLDTWLKDVKANSATASMSWERVKLNVLDNHPTRLFDLAAFYNRDNPEHYETMVVLFDHTKQYSQDDQAVSYVALTVHELRTPLTLLRGYIEALQEEIGQDTHPELVDFMQKMNAAAQQLTAFVNNILNVARIDNDQLQLSLHQENWAEIVQSAVNSIALRAKVRGINIETSVAPDIPLVGVDRLSIHEVINNLIDNAIKYSGQSKTIKVDAHMTEDGLVETTVQDFGLGINANIMANLFTKFYRDHRNRSQVGGTGLGLYLSKAIVSAHGGNIWVKSTLGKGSTFGFTIQPYSRLAEELKNSDNKEIVRGAHGWIKNHSLYRR